MTLGSRLFRHYRALAILMLALSMGAPAEAGRLSTATSSYLLMHADDAIDWHPWGDEALALARREEKLIFLSIGYASCYWCHVMARTTFKDRRAIAALNEGFISILVDREERPDVDGHFMEIMLAMRGSSGYPANFFLTPDLVPLFAAGYLAPEPEYGEPGFVALTHALAREWAGNREGILSDAAIIRGQLRDLAEPISIGDKPGAAAPREAAVRSWSGAFDETHGGFGGEPKFLHPNVLTFLLRWGVWRGDKALKDNVFRTLDLMAAGGVRDQLGGAFHRYAVDRFWQIPHFEIMLDENALLAGLYLEAYQASGKFRYAADARGILDDLLDRFRLPGGGFASSLDAETEGREGLFYTWTADEVRSALGADKAEAFIEAYVDPFHGLVEGRSVLRLLGDPRSLVRTQDQLADSRRHLLRQRGGRPPPRRDDKVLTSWNALAVSAFSKGAQVLDDPRYLRVAREELARLLAPLSNSGRLTHSRRGGRAAGPEFVDDYAFLVQALLDVFETDFRSHRLDTAQALMEALIGSFQERPGTPFLLTPAGLASAIPARAVLDENNVPSGNAAALAALRRLALFGSGKALEDQARAISSGLGRYLDERAPSASGLLGSLDYSPDEAHEIVIVGNLEDGDTRRLLREVRTRLLHGTVLAMIAPDAPAENENWPCWRGVPCWTARLPPMSARKGCATCRSIPPKSSRPNWTNSSPRPASQP